MIASLRGTIQDISTDNIILEIGGVGFQVYLPAPIREQLKPNQSVFLFTYLVVREDSLTLYGFDTRESKELFGLLLGVSGIGPRLALSVLSTLTPEAIRRAVFHEQAEVFSRVPGVGKKTAQKILLHLQDRVPAEVGLEPVAEFSDVDGEVLNALTALGYSVVEAQAAIQSIPRDTDQDIEVRLRLALQYFSRS
jgi:holliday junction DNA helicase RuvA